MKKSSLYLFAASFLSLGLAGCNITNVKEVSSIEEEVDNTVDVFVLSGQSNMEGSTYYDNGKDWLNKACEKLGLDSTPMFEGYSNILTSFYGYYPYEAKASDIKLHCSNKENPMDGLFTPTKVGMGNRDDFMGPEIGLAEALKGKATEARPIYFIKCAFSGSGFSSNDPNWVNDPADKRYNASKNLYENKLKVYTENNLRLIEESGKVPHIRGFLWHQGESDTGNSNYFNQMNGMVERFREDFASYALDGDGQNIAFIDGYIYDGPSSPYGQGAQTLNNAKKRLAESKDNNYVVNTSFNIEGGMRLEIGLKQGDVEGGCDIYHYKTKDCVRMGMAYGDIILENVLKD